MLQPDSGTDRAKVIWRACRYSQSRYWRPIGVLTPERVSIPPNPVTLRPELRTCLILKLNTDARIFQVAPAGVYAEYGADYRVV